MLSSSEESHLRFLAWKKNAPQVYDVVLAFELPWPSLSLEWLPELIHKERAPRKPGVANKADPVFDTRQRLVLTTNTGGASTEYLRIAELDTPRIPDAQSLGEIDADQGTVGNYLPKLAADLRIVQRIQVNGVVEKARYMPQNPNVIATIASTGEAAIWDITKFPYKPIGNYIPTVRLVGHQAECLALGWSPAEEGLLASGDGDGEIFIWDLAAGYDSGSSSMEPKRKRFHAAKTAVNDLVWHPLRRAVLASCGDDGWLYVHQVANDNDPPLLSHHFGADSVKPTALAWNPVNQSLLAVGFDSGKIALLDLRSSPAVVIYEFEPKGEQSEHGHSDYITSLKWNSWHPSMFASASADGTTKIWNAALFVQRPLFTHGGHKSAITDISWNPAVPNMLASVSEDNGLHIYQPSDELLGFENEIE